MREETKDAEREVRNLIENLGYKLSSVAVYEWEDGADIELNIQVGDSDENPYQVK